MTAEGKRGEPVYIVYTTLYTNCIHVFRGSEGILFRNTIRGICEIRGSSFEPYIAALPAGTGFAF